MATLEAFFCPSLSEAKIGDTVVLPESEQKHLKVKRYHESDEITLTNGSGVLAHARILGESMHYAAQITEILPQDSPSPMKSILFLALLKGKAFDEAVKMAVELGVDIIVPWQSSRSIAKWHTEKKELDALKRLVIESSKQSRRAYFPCVSNLITGKNISKKIPAISVINNENDAEEVNIDRFIMLYEHSDVPLRNVLTGGIDKLLTQGNVSRETYIGFVIGPEGGISIEDYNMFRAYTAVDASLGKNILRAPTAVAATLSCFSNFITFKN